MTPFIIPFFLEQLGCPQRCAYCDQRASGAHRAEPLSSEAVAQGIETALNRRVDKLNHPPQSPRQRGEGKPAPFPSPSYSLPVDGAGRGGVSVEAAFYGGTFTALPFGRQQALLRAAAPFLADGRLTGLRVSTRPDALGDDAIDLLESHGVKTVEIGAQSFDDRVLDLARRGHTADQTRQAARRVKAAGLRLGLQLMPGLPGEDASSRAATLREALSLAPNDVRIYPLVVLRGTPLAQWHEQGRYQPLTLDEAVSACADMVSAFVRAGSRVIRVGLQADETLAANIVAGPHHPAMGELVKSEIFFRAAQCVLERNEITGEPTIFVSPRDLSLALGQSRANAARLTRHFNLSGLTVRPDPALARGWFGFREATYPIYT